MSGKSVYTKESSGYEVPGYESAEAMVDSEPMYNFGLPDADGQDGDEATPSLPA